MSGPSRRSSSPPYPHLHELGLRLRRRGRIDNERAKAVHELRMHAHVCRDDGLEHQLAELRGGAARRSAVEQVPEPVALHDRQQEREVHVLERGLVVVHARERRAGVFLRAGHISRGRAREGRAGDAP